MADLPSRVHCRICSETPPSIPLLAALLTKMMPVSTQSTLRSTAPPATARTVWLPSWKTEVFVEYCAAVVRRTILMSVPSVVFRGAALPSGGVDHPDRRTGRVLAVQVQNLQPLP
jgi:hypothetical protein